MLTSSCKCDAIPVMVVVVKAKSIFLIRKIPSCYLQETHDMSGAMVYKRKGYLYFIRRMMRCRLMDMFTVVAFNVTQLLAY